jgi:hypothetical protein
MPPLLRTSDHLGFDTGDAPLLSVSSVLSKKTALVTLELRQRHARFFADSTNTTIYAIDTTTHQSVWSLPTSGYLALSEYGVLYVVEAVSGSATGNVFALNVK